MAFFLINFSIFCYFLQFSENQLFPTEKRFFIIFSQLLLFLQLFLIFFLLLLSLILLTFSLLIKLFPILSFQAHWKKYCSYSENQKRLKLVLLNLCLSLRKYLKKNLVFYPQPLSFFFINFSFNFFFIQVLQRGYLKIFLVWRKIPLLIVLVVLAVLIILKFFFSLLKNQISNLKRKEL